MWPLLYGTSCCFIEFAALIGSRFDFDRYGLVPRSSPRQADLILTAGTVTMKMAPSLVRLYEQMSEPKYVIAMGACTITGGMFSTDSYSTVRGVDKLIPVDVYLPGCPPKPEAIIDAIVRLRKKVAQESLSQKDSFQQEHRYHTTRHHFISSLPTHTGVYIQSQARRAPPRPFSLPTQVSDLNKSPSTVLQNSSTLQNRSNVIEYLDHIETLVGLAYGRIHWDFPIPRFIELLLDFLLYVNQASILLVRGPFCRGLFVTKDKILFVVKLVLLNPCLQTLLQRLLPLEVEYLLGWQHES